MDKVMNFEIKVKILNADNSCSNFQTREIGFGLTELECRDSALGRLLWALKDSFVKIVEVKKIEG